MRILFWAERDTAEHVDLSETTSKLLKIESRRLRQRQADILREIFSLFGEVTEANLLQYLNSRATD